MTENIQPVVISLIPNVDAPEAIEFFRHLGICITVWAFIDRRQAIEVQRAGGVVSPLAG